MPSYQDYKQYKEKTLEIFAEFEKNCTPDTDLTAIKAQIEKIKANHFTLAIAGEAKAGKSTFINALLGVDLLPTGVLQATSAIIKIVKEAMPKLTIKYADGTQEEYIDDIASLKAKLVVVGSIQDQYRTIPHTLLDEYIKGGFSHKNVTDTFLTELTQKGGEDYKIQKEAIIDYVKNTSKANIPEEIRIAYPLPWEFDEFSVVDTPGVNATGGVQNTTYNYIAQANAILFVHSIGNIASESFKKFVEGVSDKSCEYLFLLLTHANSKTKDDVDATLKEAKRTYQGKLKENRVFAVDSLARLVYQDLKNGKTLDDIKKNSPEKKKIIPELKDLAEEQNTTDYMSVANAMSSFTNIEKAINQLSTEAPCLQLVDVLNKIIEYHRSIIKIGKENIDLKKVKYQNPQDISAQIAEKKKEIEEYSKTLNSSADDLKAKYSGNSAFHVKEAEKLKKKYSENLRALNENNLEQTVRKQMADFVNEIDNLEATITKDFKETYATLNINGTTDIKKTYIPKVDVDALIHKAKSQSYKKEDVYKDVVVIDHERRWYTLWIGKFEVKKTVRQHEGTKDVFDNAKFRQNTIEEAVLGVSSIGIEASEALTIMTAKYIELLRIESINLLEQRKIDLDNIEKTKQTNEELHEEIKAIEKQISLSEQAMQKIEPIILNLNINSTI